MEFFTQVRTIQLGSISYGDASPSPSRADVLWHGMQYFQSADARACLCGMQVTHVRLCMRRPQLAPVAWQSLNNYRYYSSGFIIEIIL